LRTLRSSHFYVRLCILLLAQVALESTPFGCTASLPLQFALLVVNAAVAWHCIHRPAYRSKLRSL
jgi:hypothetical protein